jgi:hypothetical protein
MLYRIDREWDEYQGAGMYETKKYYQYVCGLRNVGKACLNAEPDDRVVRVVKLCFSLRGLIVCLKKTCTSIYNQTNREDYKDRI